MKSLILVFAILTAIPSFADQNSTFVDDTLSRAQQMLSIKDDADRTAQLCGLLKVRIGSQDIASLWLGTYESLIRDQSGINEFKGLVPSVMMSTILPLLGSGGNNVSVIVDPNSTNRGNDVYEVSVTFRTNTKDYSGIAVVKNTGGVLTVIDAVYNGYSAVDYQGREYQKFLNREYNTDPNNSLPVTALVQSIVSQEDFIRCP